MLLYLTLFACAAVMGVQVYRYDLHDREPVRVLFVAVFLGAVLMWLAGRVQVAALTLLGPWAAAHWNASVSGMAGVTEEAGKLIGVVLIARFMSKSFNEPMDGIVYGSFVGLGAALEESVALVTGHQRADFLQITEPVRLMGHLVMGGIGAAGLGFWRVGRRGWWWMLPACWFMAVLLHTAWDLVAFSAADARRMLPWHTIASMALMLAGLVAYRGLVKILEPMSRARIAASNTHATDSSAADQPIERATVA